PTSYLNFSEPRSESMARLLIVPFVTSVLVPVWTILGCGVMPAGQGKEQKVSTTLRFFVSQMKVYEF
ncbi:hypothetical protein KIN20_007547, partial [Parelaphostrongylus tenuis]